MESSIALVADYLEELGTSVTRGEPIGRQVSVARRAERRMLAKLGSNTHKGAIFICGILVMARYRTDCDDEGALRCAVSRVARQVAAASAPRGTHGEVARDRFHVGGILREAEMGLPSIFEVAVPAFRDAVAGGEVVAALPFRMLASLMQTVEDTTALHRCGSAGLARLREDGALLARLIPAGAHIPFLRERNAMYRRMNLTMGGVADLLAAALGWLVHRGEIRWEADDALPGPSFTP
jgi:triphosphoribosyl-dephospho-CoA synthase